MSLIYGHRFHGVCDCQVSPGEELPRREINYVFCHGHHLEYVIEKCRVNKPYRYVIVSHNSDFCVLSHKTDLSYKFVESEIPANVIRICAQNCDVLSNKIRPIPIGLENPEWHPGKMELVEKLASSRHSKSGILYVNHSPSTNPGEREWPLEHFSRISWATVVRGKNGQNVDGYLKDVARHRFVLCPEGNGLDTHRLWEALYLGAIPVVKRRVFTEMFSRVLPILIVDSWEQLTYQFLERKWVEMRSRTREALDFLWWEQVIRGERKIA